MGYKKGDKIGVLAQNRVEWTILDVACSALGIILVPFYDTQTIEDLQHVIQLTQVKRVFTELRKLGRFGSIFEQNNVTLTIFDDSTPERLYLKNNSEKLKIRMPQYISCIEKQQEYYEQINGIYQNEKQPDCQQWNDNVISCKFIEQVSMYNYLPEFASELDQKTFFGNFVDCLQDAAPFLKLIDTSYHQILALSHQSYKPSHKILISGHPEPQRSPIHYKLDLVTPDDDYTLVFTSGTTSLPKAAMLTHSNYIATAETMQRQCLLNSDCCKQDYVISYLPLAHIYMRVLQGVSFFQIAATGYVSEGTKSLLDDIGTCGPTALFLVPRVVEKIYDGIVAKVQKANLIIRTIFAVMFWVRLFIFKKEAAKRHSQSSRRECDPTQLAADYKTWYGCDFDINSVLGDLKAQGCGKDQLNHLRNFHQQQYNAPLDYPKSFLRSCTDVHYPAFTNIAFKQLGKLVGGRIRGGVSGSAAIQPVQGVFFKICFDSQLFQGYGLSETAAGVTVQSYFSANYQGVGRTLGTEVKAILRSRDGYSVRDRPFPRGELIVAGNTVFKGYLGEEPSQEIEKLKKELNIPSKINIHCTGDVGRFNFVTGELEIVDRLSSIVKLSQGEFVQLSNVELAVSQHPKVAQCFVVAKSCMNCLVAVVSVKPPYWANRAEYVEQVGVLREEITALCRSKKMSGMSIPKKIIADQHEWTPENGMLTPAMKVKKATCNARFEQAAMRLYNGATEWDAAQQAGAM